MFELVSEDRQRKSTVLQIIRKSVPSGTTLRIRIRQLKWWDDYTMQFEPLYRWQRLHTTMRKSSYGKAFFCKLAMFFTRRSKCSTTVSERATENARPEVDDTTPDSRGGLKFHMHYQYRGSIEYRDTRDGIVIVVPISGIAQHYFGVRTVVHITSYLLTNLDFVFVSYSWCCLLFCVNVVILFSLWNMSHYNFKKITVVPGGKVISLSTYIDMYVCLTVCKTWCNVFIGVIRVLLDPKLGLLT